MVNTARAAILYEIDKPLRVETITLPKLKVGQVLVKIHYSGVCRSQLMEIKGLRGHDKWLPHMLGHEGSGEVVAIGEGVSKVKPGDFVVVGWVKGLGIDAPGAIYRMNGRNINSGPVTTFSNYSVISENRVYKKPKGVCDKSAFLFGCALPTGSGIVFNQIQPRSSDKIAVIGLGGVGMAAFLALRASGIDNTIVIDPDPKKLYLAQTLGAKFCINPEMVDVAEEVFRRFPSGLDKCVECAGYVETIELGFSLIKFKTGRLIFASHPPSGGKITLDPHELLAGKQILGSWGGGVQPDRDLEKFNKRFSDAQLDINLMISNQYQLDDINVALDDLENNRGYRTVIKMDHD